MERPASPPPTDGAMPPGKRRSPLGRAWLRFMNDPASGRNVIILIVVANLTAVVVGGVLIWFFDRPEFEHLSEALWYSLQTVTTVGYGDVTPTDPTGRFIGAGIMLLGLAFLSILTASITSSFIEARQVESRAREEADDAARWARLDARLDGLIERLDRLERSS